MKKIILLSAVLLGLFARGASAADVTDFGTNGADDTKAFTQALSLLSSVEVPAGDYYIKSLTVPANKKLTGDAEDPPVLHVLEDDSPYLLDMQSGSALSNIKIVNDAGKEKAVNVKYAKDVTLSGVEISGFTIGVYNDHGNNMTCDGMKIYDIDDIGISTVFASGITVRNSVIQNCKNHGVEFWNNDNGKRVGGELLFEDNDVADIGSGGIWGSGGTGVIMRRNTVDNCGDVGLDVEYVKDAEIYDNTAMRCANGGVSCFMTCDGVKIHNNKIYNNRPVYEKNDYMAGIWLTTENNQYKYDTGNKNINIYDNFIYCISENGSHTYTREAIRICTRNYNQKNIHLSNNTILGIPYRILFDVSGGGRYSYDANLMFDADGSSYSITAENQKQADGQYKNKWNVPCGKELKAGESYEIRNSVMDRGAAEAAFYVTKKETSADAKVLAEVINEESGEVLTSCTVSASKLNGEKISLYYDKIGSENVIFKVTALGTKANFTLDRLAVNTAQFNPFVMIKTVDGMELLNNSYCPTKATLVFKKPENEYGIQGCITITNHSSNRVRQNIAASWIQY